MQPPENQTRDKPLSRIFPPPRRASDIAYEKRFDEKFARWRVWLIEANRTYCAAHRAIAEREFLYAQRKALRWNGGLAAVDSMNGLTPDPLGPLPDELPGEFLRRVNIETPRLTLADFLHMRPDAWWDEEPDFTNELLEAAWARPRRKRKGKPQ